MSTPLKERFGIRSFVYGFCLWYISHIFHYIIGCKITGWDLDLRRSVASNAFYIFLLKIENWFFWPNHFGYDFSDRITNTTVIKNKEKLLCKYCVNFGEKNPIIICKTFGLFLFTFDLQLIASNYDNFAFLQDFTNGIIAFLFPFIGFPFLFNFQLFVFCFLFNFHVFVFRHCFGFLICYCSLFSKDEKLAEYKRK